MNRSIKPAAIASLTASVLLLAGCGAGAAAQGEGGPGAPASTAAAVPGSASAAAAAAPGSTGAAGQATAPGLARHRHTFHAVATGKPHHRRPTHSAPLLYSRR
jgi:hypothetical protein